MSESGKIWYVTKWWESSGPVGLELLNRNGYAIVRRSAFGNSTVVYPGKDAFSTKAEAEARIRELAARKVASLRKKIDKITAEWLEEG